MSAEAPSLPIKWYIASFAGALTLGLALMGLFEMRVSQLAADRLADQLALHRRTLPAVSSIVSVTDPAAKSAPPPPSTPFSYPKPSDPPRPDAERRLTVRSPRTSESSDGFEPLWDLLMTPMVLGGAAIVVALATLRTIRSIHGSRRKGLI